MLAHSVLAILLIGLAACATPEQPKSASDPRTSGPEDLAHPQPFVRSTRATGSAIDLVFDSTGERLFHAGTDKSVWVTRAPDWEPAQRFHLPTWHGSDGAVYDLAISPDDRWLAVGGCQGCSGRWAPEDTYVIYLLDAKTGDIVGSGDLLGTTRELEFSPDGRWLAVADASARVSIWRVDESGRISRDAMEGGHTAAINGLAWSHDSSGFYTAGRDGLLVRWERHPVGGWFPAWHKAHEVSLTAVATSPKTEDAFLATSDGRIELIDPATGEFVELLRKLEGGTAFALHMMGGGLRLVYGTGAGKLTDVGIGSIDFGDGAGNYFERTRASVFEVDPRSAGEGPIAAITSDGEVRFFERDRHRFVRAIPRLRAETGWLTSKGSVVAFKDSSDDETAISFDTSTLERSVIEDTNGFTGGNAGVYRSVKANSPTAGQIRTQRPRANRYEILTTGTRFINAWAVFGRRLFAIAQLHSLAMIDFAAGTHLECFGHSGRLRMVSWMRGGELLVSSSHDGTIRFWNAGTCELLMTVFDDGQSEWIAWTPDARYAHSPNGARLLGFRVNQGARAVPLIKSTEDYPDLYQPEHLIKVMRAGTARPTGSRERER